MMNRGYEFVSVIIILLCACLVNGQYNQFIETFPQVNKTALKELQGLGPKSAFDGFMPQSIPLSPCPSLPVPADTDNVNNLRPGNIKVVMAMGDSITAGMSAKDTTFLSMKEYRGLAYSIGGDAGITTVPNLLLPYVGAGYPIGASKGIGKRDMKTNGFNAAVSGAINIDLLSQAQWLVKTLQANKAIDYNRDWKLLTVWIGSNNLCDVCSDESNNNADNFEKYVTEALEYIHANVPRVFVNLVVNLDITQLDSITKGLCNILHSVACSCVTKENNKAKVLKANIEYQQRAPKIAQKFAAKNDPQFAVVVQPFLAQTLIEERSELSKADCFHPSSYSHGVAAIALWNNMISPAAQKKSAWKLNDVPVCANPDTLLYTH